MDSPAYRAAETAWRMESARIIATLARMLRDLGLAEDFAQEALVAALEHWPRSGVPERPGAWLTTIARRRALDHLRHRALVQRKHEALGLAAEESGGGSADEGVGLAGDIDDDLLRLIFAVCHPVLPAEGRVALVLRLLAGLTTAEIARAFLVSEATLAQRIVRAKRVLAEAPLDLEAPQGLDRERRLASVLEVLYLIFNEGFSASAGEDWVRPGLCEEAQRLGRALAKLCPDHAEVHGLLALMELQASRLAARESPDGEPILLLDQDRSLWDRTLIRRGLTALARAEALQPQAGPYTLQAAIAACHARAREARDTDWVAIAGIYDRLARTLPSPVVELNRAVALSLAFGPAVGLELVERLAADLKLARYHLLPSVRGDLLAKLGRFVEAQGQFELALGLTQNQAECRLLKTRIAACRAGRYP